MSDYILKPLIYSRNAINVTTTRTPVYTCPTDKNSQVHSFFISNITDNNNNVLITVEIFYPDMNFYATIIKDVLVKTNTGFSIKDTTLNLNSGDIVYVKSNTNDAAHCIINYAEKSN